jgi:hypothetical protein
MSKRDIARFGFAIFLVAFSVLALLSVWTFSPRDPCVWGLVKKGGEKRGQNYFRFL